MNIVKNKFFLLISLLIFTSSNFAIAQRQTQEGLCSVTMIVTSMHLNKIQRVAVLKCDMKTDEKNGVARVHFGNDAYALKLLELALESGSQIKVKVQGNYAGFLLSINDYSVQID